MAVCYLLPLFRAPVDEKEGVIKEEKARYR
jgi:hypothetical protein